MLDALLSSPGNDLYKFYRRQFINSLVFALGCHLKRDLSMEEALFKTSQASTKRFYKTRLENASTALNNGESVEAVVRGSTLSFLPDKIRVILASNISNENKGKLLVDWNQSKYSAIANKNQYAIVLVTGSVGILVAISLLMFVIPQFREISMGLGVPLPQVFSWLVYLSHNMYLGVIAVMIAPVLLVGIFYVLVKIFFNMSEQVDYANLFKLLSIIDRDNLQYFIPLLSNKTMFPNKYASFNKFALAINNGVLIEEAAKNANIDRFNLWFLKLGLENNESSLILESASKMIDSKLEVSKKVIINFGVTLAMLIQGIAIGVVVYGVFSMMIQILMMSFQTK